ncbi:MAG: recombination factor protein RarA, partial [Pseudomonadota bacterium]|nr:recombination factor protein RarA [Pseudomonadota bacterium]
KSNAVYNAFKQAMRFVKDNRSADVPLHLRNAPTQLMKDQGYGKEYRYAHNYEGGYVPDEQYFPDAFSAQPPTFYEPVERGLEIKIKQKLMQLKQLDQQARHEEGKEKG